MKPSGLGFARRAGLRACEANGSDCFSIPARERGAPRQTHTLRSGRRSGPQGGAPSGGQLSEGGGRGQHLREPATKVSGTSVGVLRGDGGGASFAAFLREGTHRVEPASSGAGRARGGERSRVEPWTSSDAQGEAAYQRGSFGVRGGCTCFFLGVGSFGAWLRGRAHHFGGGFGRWEERRRSFGGGAEDDIPSGVESSGRTVLSGADRRRTGLFGGRSPV